MPKNCSSGNCMDATSLTDVSALDLLLVDFTIRYERCQKCEKSLSIVFYHWLHVRIPHPSLRVTMLESATGRAVPLEIKLTALKRDASQSKTLKSKVIVVLKHTPKPPTLYNVAQKPVELSWLILVPVERCERRQFQIEYTCYLANAVAFPICFGEVLATTRTWEF